MQTVMTLDEVLGQAEKLDADTQEELFRILGQRLGDRRREQLIADVEEANREFAEGRCQVVTPEELTAEALQ